MKALVIGGRGFVGAKLAERLMPNCYVTTRETLDLSWPIKPFTSVAYDTVFQVAAMTKFMDCGDNPRLSYAVNVDAQIAIADMAIQAGAFPVFISSDVVEVEPHTAYGHQKATVEAYFRHINGAIVRPTRIVERRVGEFCDFLIGVGEKREKGVFRWK